MGFKMKKGSGTANANTPGAFNSKDTDTLKNLSKNAFDVDAPVDPSFKSDAGEVTGIVRRVSDKPISFKDTGHAIGYPTVRDVEGESIPGAGRYLSMAVERDRAEGTRVPSYKNIIPKGNIKDVTGRSAEEFLTVKTTLPGSKKISFTRPMFK